MTRQEPPVVFIVDDDETMRRGLSRLLRSNGLNVEAFPSAEAFLQRAPFGGVGCVLLDLRMPGMGGMQLQEELCGAGISLPIVFLTAHADVPVSVRAMKRGASDFLVKPVDEQVLLEAIRAALARCEAETLAWASEAGARAKTASLTAREREVLQGVVAGRLNKQIALALGITEATVKVHRGHIMQKMGAGSVVELVHLCKKAGFTPMDL